MAFKDLKIVIVDNSGLMYDVIKNLAKKYFGPNVVAETGTYHQAPKMAQKSEPDLIVMYQNHSRTDTIDTIRKITFDNKDVKILLIVTVLNISQIEAAIQAGVSGMIMQGSMFFSLACAIDAICDGQQYYCPEVKHLQLTANRDVTI